jgi:hypothetical protein
MMPDYQASYEAEEDYFPWDLERDYPLDLDIDEGDTDE